MKKIYALVLLMAFATVLCAQINEGFEGTFPPAGWTVQSPDGGTGWDTVPVGTSPIPGWNGGTITSAPTNGGLAVAFCTWSTGGASSNDQWLITPQVTIVAGDEVSCWIRKFGAYADNVKILLSTTGAAVADFTVTIATINYLDTDTGWTSYSYSLDSYAGQSVYIAFNEYVADNLNDGAAISLDNVVIGAGSGIPETPVNSLLSIYPNPTVDFINIDSYNEIIRVKLYNNLGQLVNDDMINGNHAQINASSYSSGMYLISIETTEGTSVRKVLIK